LLGTAHISEVSAALAASLIQDTHPNAVFVELDLKRVGGIVRQSRAKLLPAASNEAAEDTLTSATPAGSPLSQLMVPAVASAQAIAVSSPDVDALPAPQESRGLGGWFQRKALNFASNAVGNALRGMYNNLNQAGFNPGEEFATAIREGQKIGATIVLGDQDVEYTLRRLTQALAATDLDKLLSPDAKFERTMQELLPGGPDSMQPDAKNYDDPAKFKQDLTEYVERLKSRESVRKIMSQLNEVAPALVQVMLTERDAYMATGIDTLNQFECIVAVMGIAHQDGVEENLRQKGWKQVRLRC
jgi:pheromone shutdown protein TraB